MSMIKIEQKDYSDGVTKQAFKDQCDINKILKRAQKTGSLAFAQKYPEAEFGEFEGVDLLTAHRRIKKAERIFADLPSEVRKEFSNNALAFAEFASNPANRGRLAELLPAIAEPGPWFPNPVRRLGQGAGAATAPNQEAQPTPTATQPQTGSPDPSASSST